ncbi:DUF362 domain-containing protein [Candidatus Latescibacterota bacterium]
MFNRRDFIKTATAAGSLGLTHSLQAFASKQAEATGFFGVHRFIENNPEAVFIMKTNVDVKNNAEAKVKAGSDFSSSVFVPVSEEDGGAPLTHNVAIKPNMTWAQMTNSKATEEGCRGIVTDPEVVEGVVEGMKGLGLSSSQFYTRDKWSYNGSTSQLEFVGYKQMSERTGVNIGGSEQGAKADTLSEDQVVWIDIPDGEWFTRIPYLWPINSPDSFLLNIAKFKAHSMGITGCAKNLQGSIATPYVGHCTAWGRSMGLGDGHVVTDAYDNIKEHYDRHVADGIPRWEKAGTNVQGGLGMETWCHRCLDNNSVTKPALHITEGVYGRNGNFVDGPGEDGLAQDFMSNVIIFGKNAFNVDIISHWLAGHEPGNIGLFHLAIERNQSTKLNPMDIPVYEWTADGAATRTPLTDFDRTPLLTLYMRKDYNGNDEAKYHMVDEPFEYSAATGVFSPDRPQAIVLNQNIPNPFNPSTAIEYNLPSNGHVRVEVFNAAGQLVDVLADGYRSVGSHMAVWNTNNQPSGIYFYRLRFGGFSETKKMTLLK